MKKLVVSILLIFLTSTAFAEKGELQFFAGSGGFFPFNITTHDKTTLIVATLNIPVSISWGFSDNFYLTFSGAFSYYNDAFLDKYKDSEGVTGDLYFNWKRIITNLQVKYNLYPGYEVSPHIILGIGQNTEIITDQALYEKSVNKKSYEDYARIHMNFQAGFDVAWRIWSILMTKAEVLFDYSLTGTYGIELNVYFGLNWFY